MRAIDTNVVVRLLLRDDPAQIQAIDALVAGGELWVSLTVLIETEWVLRGVYKLPRHDVAALLAALASIEGVTVEQSEQVAWALARLSAGADLADMLHLVATRDHETFVTFDRMLARHAGDDAPLPVLTLDG